MVNNLKKYYYSTDQLELREVKWFKMKIAAGIIGSVAFCLICITLVSYLSNNFFGLNADRVMVLTQENKSLQEQVGNLTSRMIALDNEIRTLNTQGNTLRLMVDLPPVNEDISNAGTGGAVKEPGFNFTGDRTSEILHSALTSLQQLDGEMKVQQQSYREIVTKYDFNKDYFKALPALKPMEGFYSKNGFGIRMHPVLGIFKTHEGLDIINDVGTPVYASGDGIVEMAGQSGGGYGVVVAMNHGYGYQTLYAHLSRVLVHDGQHVKRGDLIAKSGKTGLVSGPHLHYEVRYNGVCKNPVDFFLDDVNIQQYRSSFVSR